MPRQAHGVLSDADASLDNVDGCSRAAWRASTRWHSAVSAGVWILVCVRRHWRPACVRSHRQRSARVSWRWALRAALAGALLASAVNLARYYPQTLSHYSLIAGGASWRSRQGHGTGVLVGCARQRRPQVAQRAHRPRRSPRLFSRVQLWGSYATGASCAHKLSDARDGPIQVVRASEPAGDVHAHRSPPDGPRKAGIRQVCRPAAKWNGSSARSRCSADFGVFVRSIPACPPRGSRDKDPSQASIV